MSWLLIISKWFRGWDFGKHTVLARKMHTISKIDLVSSFSLRSVRFINLQKNPSQLLNDVSTMIIKFLLLNKSFYVVLALLPFKTSKHITVNEKTYYNCNLIILLYFFLNKKPIELCFRKKWLRVLLSKWNWTGQKYININNTEE